MTQKIEGVGKDAPTVESENGARQAQVLYATDEVDGRAFLAMCAVLHTGREKYGHDNWRLIPVEQHINHMIIHAYAYLAGDDSDDHLSHMMCRSMFAQAVALDALDEPE